MSGNQRGGAPDPFFFTITHGSPISIIGWAGLGAIGPVGSGDYPDVVGFGIYSETLAAGRALLTDGLRWTPQAAGTLTFEFWMTSADNVGPILDNVLMTKAAIPEPATWAMLIAGFGLVGATLRCRRVAPAA